MQAAGGPVSFFFDDADVFEVVQTVFGDVLKVNYIIDPKVKGKVTFRTVTPIPKEEVLNVMEIILRINGVGFVEEKGLYRIIPLTDVSKELVYSQVGKDPGKVAIELFIFKNMNLKESMPDLENTIGLNVQGGTTRILPILRLNALMVVASTKEQMEYVRQWVEAFDSMFAGARPKITVYPLQNSKAAHVASMLSSILGGGGGVAGTATPPPTAPRPAATPAAGAAPAAAAPRAGAAATVTGGTGFLVSPDTRIFADEISNSLIILSTPADYAFIEETIRKIDTVPRQVVIEGLLVRVDLTDNLDFGMQWTIQNDFTIKGLKPFGRSEQSSGRIANDSVRFEGPLSLNTPIASPNFTFTAIDAAGNIKLALQSLASQGKAKILASPHILVSDNREARIQVGQQIPIATSTTTQPISTTTTTTATVASTSTIQYKDIGIILKVKPQINDSGLVSLEVTQEVSSQGADVNIAGQAFASINKTEATTDLVAQDGETIIIGGLIREDNTRSRDGIPFLSRIPVLGYLFGSTVDHTTRAELIILLTPRVVRNMQEAGSLTSDYIEKYKGVAKDKEINKFIEERGRKPKDGGDAGNSAPDK
jgi:general secretion pathway protein D